MTNPTYAKLATQVVTAAEAAPYIGPDDKRVDCTLEEQVFEAEFPGTPGCNSSPSRFVKLTVEVDLSKTVPMGVAVLSVEEAIAKEAEGIQALLGVHPADVLVPYVFGAAVTLNKGTRAEAIMYLSVTGTLDVSTIY